MAKKSYVKADEIQVKGSQIFSPVRRKWLPLTPEERVRQEYLLVLIEEYGYTLDQISEEMDVSGRGSAQARADFVIWRSPQDKTDQKAPFIIIGAVNAASIGSAAISRNRFKESDFFGFKVPIPPLSIQHKIVTHWEAARIAIAAAKNRAVQIEKDLQARFLSDLGLSKPKRTTQLRYFSVDWREFERWSVSYNQAIISMIDLSRGRYPVVELGSILELVQYGTSEKANVSLKGMPVLRMNNIKDGYLDYTNLKHVVLPKKTRESLLLIDGDILFNRTNSKELVGKCAVFHNSGEYVFASYLIRVRPEPHTAISDFVAYCLNSVIGRQQIDALSRQIIGQANINVQELRSLRLPLPPLGSQMEIMSHIGAGRNEIIRQGEIINRLQNQTQAEIEQMILGTRSVEDI